MFDEMVSVGAYVWDNKAMTPVEVRNTVNEEEETENKTKDSSGAKNCFTGIKKKTNRISGKGSGGGI